MSTVICDELFSLACDVDTHIETGRINVDDKFMLITAARRLLGGQMMTRQQAEIWRDYEITLTNNRIKEVK